MSSYELLIERISLRQLVAFSPTRPPSSRSSGRTFASLIPERSPFGWPF
jgi:hypothetical protein